VAARLLPDTSGLPTELLWNLTLRELRSKFKRSALGWLWSVINPLASIAIYTVVFGVFFEVEPPVGDPSGLEVYGFWLVCGLLPWTFLSNGLNGAVA
jgi:ABC-2 type transport system permease protein